MVYGFARRFCRSLVFSVLMAFAVPVSAQTASPPAPTCPVGSYPDQFGACVQACQQSYYGGTTVLAGQQVPVRQCKSAGDLVVPGETGAPSPFCWHYTGALKNSGYGSDGRRYEDYSLFTKPGDVCDAEVIDCGRDGCNRVEGPTAASPPGGTTGGGTPVPPSFDGILVSQVGGFFNSSANCTGCYRAGGTTTNSATAQSFCTAYGGSYTTPTSGNTENICKYDSATFKSVPGNMRPQIANDKSTAYIPNSSDTATVEVCASGTYPAGSCKGTWYSKFDGGYNVSLCNSRATREYRGPMSEGYNPGATSPDLVCLAMEDKEANRPRAGYTQTATDGRHPTAPEFYACEFRKSAWTSASTGYRYVGTGNACGGMPRVVAANSNIEAAMSEALKDASSSMASNIPSVPSDHYFGGAGGPYILIDGGTSRVVSDGTNVTTGAPNIIYTPSVTYGGGAPSGASGNSGGSSGGGALENDTEMPSSDFEPWYTPVYENGPKGVWEARVTAVQNSKLAQWLKGFETVGGGSFSSTWALDFSAMGYGVREVSIPPETISIIRAFVLLFALLAARKIIFGG